MDFHSLISTVLPLVGTALAAVVVHQLRGKLKLQISAEQEKILADILNKAVNFAEEWAYKQTKASPKAPPTSLQKLDQAVAFVKKEADRTSLKLSDKQIDELLHATIGSLRK